jgi:hypothetical protein
MVQRKFKNYRCVLHLELKKVFYSIPADAAKQSADFSTLSFLGFSKICDKTRANRENTNMTADGLVTLKT